MRTDADSHGAAGRCPKSGVHSRRAVDSSADLDVISGVEECGQFLGFEAGEVEAEDAIAASPLKLLKNENISPQVLCGLDSLSDRSQKMVLKLLPGFLHWLGKDFAGTKGSRVYNSLQSGDMIYRAYCFQK
jgi:hypothetical protein